MNEETKKRTVNLEDLQAGVQQTFNKGIGNEGVCITAAATAAKEVTLGTTFDLVAGATILVTFTNGISVANATLAITHTPLGTEVPVTEAAKPIYYRGAALAANLVQAGDRIILRYDGTRYNVVGTLAQDISGKVDKVQGKGLSTNDYTTNEKDKLSGIESGAQVHKAPTAAEVKSALGTGSGTSKYLREDGSWQTPPDTNTWRPLGTGANDACAGNDSRLSNARPASDVYSWAKASSKPSYSWSEITSKPLSVSTGTMTKKTITIDNETWWYFVLPMSVADAQKVLSFQYWFQNGINGAHYQPGSNRASTVFQLYVSSFVYGGATITNSWLVTSCNNNVNNVYYRIITQ